MIESLRPYPEYKGSGSELLGAVPQSWAVDAFRARSKWSSEKGRVDLPLLSVARERGVFLRSLTGEDGNHNVLPDDLSKSKVAYEGDLVINKMKAWQGSMGIAPCEGVVSPAYFVMKFQMDLRQYAHALLRSRPYVAMFARASDGVRIGQWDLDIPRMKDVPVCVPPPDEQNAIVEFLNNVNERIDKFIAAKRALISLLDEQRQSATDQALGPGAKGTRQVPLKSVVTIQSGITLGKTYPAQGTKDYSYMRVANVQAGRLDLRIVKTIRLPENEASRSMLRVGDVLVTEGGDPDKLGRGCIWSGEIEPCVHQNHIFAIRPRPEKLSAHFLQAALNTSRARDYFIRSAKQTTNLASTNRTAIGRFRVPLPDVSEQKTLLQQLEADLRPLAVAIEKANREIDLMKELQARLTADVVTGKLDVRDVQLHALNASALDELIEQNVEEAAELDKESADQ